MFLGMQDFDFAQILLKGRHLGKIILVNHPKFGSIYSNFTNFTQICPNFDQKNLLGAVA